MKTKLQILCGIVLSLVSALMLRLAFPPYHLGLLIGVGFVPMLVAQYRVLPVKIASLAPALAISAWLGAILIPAFSHKSLGMAILPAGVFLLVLVMDRNKRAFHEHTDYRWLVLEGVTGWVGLEMVRGFIPAIGTWAFVGYALWEQPALIQPLSVLGIYGLDLVIMLANYGLALAILGCKPGCAEGVGGVIPRRVAYGWAAGAVMAAVAWIGLSLWMYQARDHLASSVKVAAVQPGLPQAAHRDVAWPAEARLEILSNLTRQAASKGAQLVVWPEMALGFDPQLEHTQTLKDLARQTASYVVIGYVVDGKDGFRNEAILLTPDGEFYGPYGKTHPMVVSGEPRSKDTEENLVYTTPIGRVGMMICFDAAFTDVARRLGRQGVQLMANPSLFGPSIAELTGVMAVFRAVENRSAVVMADVAYNSGIVDPYGKMVASQVTPRGAQDVLVVEVALGTGKTGYSHFGDWLGWLSLAGLIGFATAMPASRARRLA